MSNAFDPEIAFISGVASDKKIAATSYFTWNGDTPATYTSNIPTALSPFKWGNSAIGTSGGTVTYWFDSSFNWTPSQESELISGLALWSSIANISFSQATSASSANFTFKGVTTGATSTYVPRTTTATIGSGTDGSSANTGSYIQFNMSVYNPVGSPFDAGGSESYHNVVHEEGHLIGLGHGGPTNGAGFIQAAQDQFSAYDTTLWSQMSYVEPYNPNAKYFSSYPVIGTNWGYSADFAHRESTTPMILDILAAQLIYGPPTSGPLVSGGQIFGFNCNIPGTATDDSIHRYFDFAVNINPVITIWDGGTNNTLDLSGWSTPATINLTPGTFSSADGMVNNIAIAPGTVIDHAIGGKGNDIIVGSSANDTITGGPGNDSIDGGGGFNIANYSGPAKNYTISLAAVATHPVFNVQDKTGTDGTDTLQNVQSLHFSDTILNTTWMLNTASLSSSQLTDLIELYIAYFNRAPDAVGLDYWGSRLHDGMSLQAIAKSFFVQPETVVAYPSSMSLQDFIAQVYENALGRAPDQSGLSYWSGQLQNGNLSKDSFILDIIYGARAPTGGALDAQYLANKELVGAHFALTDGLIDGNWGHTVMSNVDATSTSVTAANQLTDTYAALATGAQPELIVKIVGIAA